MSIVNKHPAPWTPMRHGPECTAYDANGVLVCEIGDGEPDREDLQRLILAAPELLAALKDVLENPVDTDDPEPFGAGADAATDARALIARIEGK
jgi:hypothetical protein